MSAGFLVAERREGRLRRGPSLRLDPSIDGDPSIADVEHVPGQQDRTAALTPRQREFLGLLAEGLSYAEIASCCGVSTSRVHAGLSGAYERLGVEAGVGRQGAAIRAFRAMGWLRVRAA